MTVLQNHMRYGYDVNTGNGDYMSHTLPKKPSASAAGQAFQLPSARYRPSRKKERSTDKTPQNSSRNGENASFF
jgi:hypothetical protein